jgi:hypothetical protein
MGTHGPRQDSGVRCAVAAFCSAGGRDASNRHAQKHARDDDLDV